MSSFPENFRGIHAIPLLKKAKNLTLNSLIKLAYDPYLPGADKLISGLIEAANKTPSQSKDVKDAIKMLKKWDAKVAVNSIEMTLAQFYINSYYESGKIPTMAFGKRTSRLARFEYMSVESPLEERMAIFEKSLQKLRDDFGSWKTPWGEFNRYQRNDGKIIQDFDDTKKSLPVGMASGKWGALASYGTQFGKSTKRQYGTSGNSFVAVVEFGAKVTAKTILAGGQSGDPNSPHFDDQAIPYIKAKFKDVAYYREDVLRRAKSIYSPGKE